MIKSDNSRFGKTLYVLYPGDYYATKENCILGTVVGSCVTVCLSDPTRGIGGMGQFIVPGTIGTRGIISDEIARRGVASMELLWGEVVKMGGDRNFLRAKIFGAGYLNSGSKGTSSISESNIRFIQEYFSFEKIHVERSDLGGDFRRRIYFSPKDGIVYRKIVKYNEEISEFVKMEKEYVDREFRDRDKTGEVFVFD